MINDWIKNGAKLTCDDYLTLSEIVFESMNRIVESRIKGSLNFNQVVDNEIDKRRQLYLKMGYLANKKEN